MLRNEIEAKDRYSVLLQAIRKMPISIILFDQCGKILYGNDAALALIRYSREEFSETVLQNLSNVFQPEELTRLYRTSLDSIEQQVILPVVLTRPDDSKVKCNLQINPIGEDNDPYILVSITEQTGQDGTVHKSNKELNQVVVDNTEASANFFEQITDGYAAFDKAWNYTYINKKAAAISGHSPEDLIGKNLWEEFPGLVGSPRHEAYLKAMDEQVVIRTQEYLPIFKKWFEGVAYPTPEGLSAFFQDITDRKAAELALEEKELMYRAVVETSHEGIWQIDAENRTSSVNDYLLSLLGCTREEIMGKSFLEFVTPESRPEAMALVEERKKGIARDHEFIFQRKDGSPAYTLIQSKPLIINGVYAGAVAMVLDNTERKKAEEKLVENEKRFRALFDYSKDGIALLTADGKIMDMSSSTEKIVGFTREELLGTSRLDFVYPEDVHLIDAAFEAVLQEPQKNKTLEYKVIAKDGTHKWLEGTFSNLLNEPAVKAIVLNFCDITERKEAEKKLKASEARYRKAQAQGRLGHWEWNLFTNQLVWSDEIYNMFGLDPTIPSPDYEQFLNCIHPDDRAFVEKEIMQALSDGKNYQFSYRIVLHDGNTRYIYTVAELVKNKSGQVTTVIGMVQDVTEQKLTQEELTLSERNYRLLFEKSPVPFWMIDYPTFNFIEVNQAAADLYGYTREEFLTMSVRDIRVENPDAYFEHINTAIPENETTRSIAQHKKKNGDILFVQLTFSRFVYNGRMARLASARDITQEMIYEKQLQDKQHQLSMIFNSVVNGMALFEVEPKNQFRFEAINDALCEGIRITREQVLGKRLVDVFGEKNIQHLLPGYEKAIATGSVVSFTAESTQRIGNRIVEYTAIPIKDDAGEVVQLLSMSHDVTEKIKAEKDLLRINNELRLLSSHLENVREEERTNISREIHDELGQQLTGLKMEVSWINRKLQQPDEEIRTRIQSSLHLIDNTINSVRRIASQLRPSILDDLGLAEALNWHRQEFSKHTGIPVTFFSNVEEIKFSPPLSIAVFRIFQETLTNVARHAKATKVRCSLEKEKDWLHLTVADNGIGFSGPSLSGRKTLGLRGMEERVAVLNGQFSIESHPGEGTTILVTIPLG